mgnify:CR=1 FL=1
MDNNKDSLLEVGQWPKSWDKLWTLFIKVQKTNNTVFALATSKQKVRSSDLQRCTICRSQNGKLILAVKKQATSGFLLYCSVYNCVLNVFLKMTTISHRVLSIELTSQSTRIEHNTLEEN